MFETIKRFYLSESNAIDGVFGYLFDDNLDSLLLTFKNGPTCYVNGVLSFSDLKVGKSFRVDVYDKDYPFNELLRDYGKDLNVGKYKGVGSLDDEDIDFTFSTNLFKGTFQMKTIEKSGRIMRRLGKPDKVQFVRIR